MKPDANDIYRQLGAEVLRNEIDRALDPDAVRKQQQNGHSWQRTAFTAGQLQHTEFPPTSWLVREIIPTEGVTLLCSRPKFGKSWLVYDLCIGATTDRFTLGEIKPAQGHVLYLALEDSKRRLKRRMTKLLPTFSGKWPDSLTITTEWRRLHEGGLDDIRGWYEETKANGGKPILVAIDVLAKVRKPSGNKPVYESDYEALTGLCQLAHELGIAIVVVHHTRKMAADDLMETVNGSYGITGAVDTVLVMASKSAGSVLDIRGRDVESAELAVQFSKDSCRWAILGTAADIHQSDQRKEIIAVLADNGEPTRINEIVAATGMKRNPLELLLGRMVKEGLIKRVGSGRYAHKEYVEPPAPNGPGKGKSVRSVSSVSLAGQIRDGGEPADGAQQNTGIYLSVASVGKFTSKADADDQAGVAAERVKTQTDPTDGQICAQASEKASTSNFKNLSDLQTDQTDGRALTKAHEGSRFRCEAIPADLGIPTFLDRRNEPPCAHCGRPGGTEWDYAGNKVRLHPRCEDAWLDARHSGGGGQHEVAK